MMVIKMIQLVCTLRVHFHTKIRAQHQNDSTCEYVVCTLSHTNVHKYGHHWFNLHVYIHVHVCVHFLTKVCVVMVVEMSSKRFKLHLANCNQQSIVEHSGVRVHHFVIVHCNLALNGIFEESKYLSARVSARVRVRDGSVQFSAMLT